MGGTHAEEDPQVGPDSPNELICTVVLIDRLVIFLGPRIRLLSLRPVKTPMLVALRQVCDEHRGLSVSPNDFDWIGESLLREFFSQLC